MILMKKLRLLLTVVLMCIVCVYTVSAAEQYRITVNKSTNCVTVFKADEKGEYKPYKAMICSVGKDNSTPTGSFRTQAKYTWRELFGNVYGQYATRINGHILFHSVYYKSTSPDTLDTAGYNKLGTAASMGCIRLTVADAKWIYDNCPVGTQVDIINSGDDPLERPAAIKLGANSTHPNWDPTDPNPNNPWKNEGVKFHYIALHKKVKSEGLTSEKLAEVVRNGIAAFDTANNIIYYDLSYDISPDEEGKYAVKYFATDVLGNYGEITGSITIE